MLNVDDFIDRTRSARTSEALLSAFTEAVCAEGFDNHVIARINNGAVTGLVSADLPEGYADAYLNDRWDLVDPVLSFTHRARKPFLWSNVVSQLDLTKAQKQFLRDCRDTGVVGGFTVPLHSPGRSYDIISVSLREDKSLDPDVLPKIYAICMQTWLQLSELEQMHDGSPECRPVLTEREIEVLRWVRDGKSYWATGKILGVTEKTISYHMTNIMKKFGTSNRVSTVVVAIQLGFLEL